MRLHRAHTCFVEQIRNSGFTDSGIYVLDEDNTKDLRGRPITLYVRVTQAFKCDAIEPGKVYLIENPYAFELVGDLILMHEENFLCEVEGYDEAVQEISEALDAQKYPVCGKC